jgi:hypothetical protein
VKRKCSACAGRGYILAKNNVHGLRIERCDTCEKYATDDQAVIKAHEDGNVECHLENDGKVLAVGIKVPVTTKVAKRCAG